MQLLIIYSHCCQLTDCQTLFSLKKYKQLHYHVLKCKTGRKFREFWDLRIFLLTSGQNFIRVYAIRCVLVSVCLFITKILQLTQVRFSGLRRDSSGLYLAVGSLYDKSWGSSY